MLETTIIIDERRFFEWKQEEEEEVEEKAAMKTIYKVFCLIIFIDSNRIIAHDNVQKDLTIRSIDSNSKTNDQPFRVNLTCKFCTAIIWLNLGLRRYRLRSYNIHQNKMKERRQKNEEKKKKRLINIDFKC